MAPNLALAEFFGKFDAFLFRGLSLVGLLLTKFDRRPQLFFQFKSFLVQALHLLQLSRCAIWHGCSETFGSTHQVLLVEAVERVLSEILAL